MTPCYGNAPYSFSFALRVEGLYPVAKVDVEGSNPFSRSKNLGKVPRSTTSSR